MRIFSFIVGCILCFCGPVIAAGNQFSHVSDQLSLLAPEEKQRINLILAHQQARTDVEIMVLIVGSLRDFDHDGPIEDFATTLMKGWRNGNSALDDAVVVVLAMGDQQMRIEMGPTYGHSKDAQMQSVVNDYFLPKFSEQDFYGGVELGLRALVFALSGEDPLSYID